MKKYYQCPEIISVLFEEDNDVLSVSGKGFDQNETQWVGSLDDL